MNKDNSVKIPFFVCAWLSLGLIVIITTALKEIHSDNVFRKKNIELGYLNYKEVEIFCKGTGNLYCCNG